MKNANEPNKIHRVIFSRFFSSSFSFFPSHNIQERKKGKNKNGKKKFYSLIRKELKEQFSTRIFARYELTQRSLAGRVLTLDSLAPSFGPDRGSAAGLAPVEFHSLNPKQLIERIKRALQPATTAPEQSAKLLKL